MLLNGHTHQYIISLIWENRQKKLATIPYNLYPLENTNTTYQKKIKKNQKETLESETKVGNFSL